jgi:hypothetical protein
VSFLTWLRQRGAAPPGRPDAALSAVPAARPAADDDVPATPYASFRVLLDTPASEPDLGLGFGHYARALTDLIVGGRAEFAIGIFGGWGSGKTTLMRAIMRRLDACENVVPVWFAAWRYEKDPNLLLPLLDVLREALEKKAACGHGWARDAAVAVGHAGLAFFSGLTISGGAGVQVAVDISKVREAAKAGRKGPVPLSYYHDGFRKLREAIRVLSAGGTRRVVIFIDDLDRCMPPNALQVLESMKLFFDEEGCVFVVGLDHAIVDLAVAEKYRPPLGNAADVSQAPDVPAPPAEYLKKLFQVPFTLPGIGASELRGYLDKIEQSTELSEAQRWDFGAVVRPHFLALQGARPVNPREVKRLLNMYTMQLKMFSAQAAEAGEDFNHNVVLALLCLNARDDWRVFYYHLVADPQFTQNVLSVVAESPGGDEIGTVPLGGVARPLDTEIVEYLRHAALPMLKTKNLRRYISAAESTSSTDPRVLAARMAAFRLRAASDALTAGHSTLSEAAGRIPAAIDRLDGAIRAHRSAAWLRPVQDRLLADVATLAALARELQVAAQSGDDGFLSRWAEQAVPRIESLDAGMLAWHRYSGLGL